jgi:hypothetical protein
MTLNDQLSMTSVSIVDCLTKADTKSLDEREFRNLIDTLVDVCSIHASTKEYVPRTMFSTQYQSSLVESAATFLACCIGMNDTELVDYIFKVQNICKTDSRIKDGFKDFHGPHASRQEKLDATEMEFGINAKILMESILNMK